MSYILEDQSEDQSERELCIWLRHLTLFAAPCAAQPQPMQSLDRSFVVKPPDAVTFRTQTGHQLQAVITLAQLPAP